MVWQPFPQQKVFFNIFYFFSEEICVAISLIFVLDNESCDKIGDQINFGH